MGMPPLNETHRPSGLIVITEGTRNGVILSGKAPSHEILGDAPKQYDNRCAKCKGYFRDDHVRLVCDTCKREAFARDKSSQDSSNGNLAEGVDRVTKHSEPVTMRTRRPKIQGEFGHKEFEGTGHGQPARIIVP